MIPSLRSLFKHHSDAPPPQPASPARKLADEQAGGFFAWFHLEADGEPQAQPDGSRHRFRPAGDAFRSLVVLDIVVDAAGGIRSAHLCLDRSFVSGPQDAFARDLAKSFLGWILDEKARERAAPLITNIADFGAANRPVLMRVPPPAPPPDPTGAYAVFMGDADAATLLLGSSVLTLANGAGRLTIEAVLDD